MAESIVQPEMINRTAYEELRAADMPEDQAKAVAPTCRTGRSSPRSRT